MAENALRLLKYIVSFAFVQYCMILYFTVIIWYLFTILSVAGGNSIPEPLLHTAIFSLGWVYSLFLARANCIAENVLFSFSFFFFFLGLYLWHMEVPRLRVCLELQLLATATATVTVMQDPSCFCDLLSLLNSLSEARD